MDRENFYHWGATRDIMEIIRRQNNSPETRRLVEQRYQLSRPGTLRRRYDQYTQRTVFAPSRPNKRSREEIAEIDAEIMRRANRQEGGYQPLTEEQDEPEELREEGELEIENTETEEDSVIMRGDNLPIVDLSKYNTDRKETKYIEINHIVGKLTSNKKITEEHIKKAEFEFMMDLKTLIAKTAIDPELTRVKNSMRREDRETIPDGYRTVFDKLSIRWGLVFVDDQIVVPIETEEDSVIMRGDNLPIVDLSKYNTDRKEAKYIQINYIVGKLTSIKKITEEHIKKAEFEFMVDLKTLIAKTAIDPELTRVKNSMRREDRETIPDGYRTVFDKLSIRWGLVFVDDQIVVPIDLRRKLLDIIHFGHSSITKMNAEAKIFWWPGMKQDIENKVKDCTACLASGKNLNYQLPKKHYGKLEKLTEPGQEIQIDFTRKLHKKI